MEDHLSVRNLDIVDVLGRPRISLSTLPDGRPAFEMKDEMGEAFLAIYGAGGKSVTVTLGDGDAGHLMISSFDTFQMLTLMDKQGNTRLSIQVNDNQPSITLQGSDEVPQIGLHVFSDTSASLSVGRDGAAQVAMHTGEQTMLSLRDEGERERLMLMLNKEAGLAPKIYLSDETDELRLAIGLDAAGKASILEINE